LFPEIFIDNLFQEIEKEALNVCREKATSIFVESVILLGSPLNCTHLLKAVVEDWEKLITHNGGSHVADTLLLKVGSFLGNEKSDSLVEVLLQVQDAMLDKLGLFMEDRLASHVMRTWIQVLGGNRVEIKSNKKPQDKLVSSIFHPISLSLHLYKLYFVSQKILRLGKQMCRNRKLN
jgi:hypothetical protein